MATCMGLQVHMHGWHGTYLVYKIRLPYASPVYMCVRDAALLDNPWYVSLLGMLRVIVYITFTSYKRHY